MQLPIFIIFTSSVKTLFFSFKTVKMFSKHKIVYKNFCRYFLNTYFLNNIYRHLYFSCRWLITINSIIHQKWKHLRNCNHFLSHHKVLDCFLVEKAAFIGSKHYYLQFPNPPGSGLTSCDMRRILIKRLKKMIQSKC